MSHVGKLAAARVVAVGVSREVVAWGLAKDISDQIQTMSDRAGKDGEVGISSGASDWKVGPPHPSLGKDYTGTFLLHGAGDDLSHNPDNSVVTVTFG